MSTELAKSTGPTKRTGSGSPPPMPQSRAAELVYRVTARPFPGPRRIAAVGLWWLRQLPPLIVRAPGLLLAELLPICRGIGRCAAAWAEFVHNSEQAERIREAEGKDKHKAGERLIRRRMARTWGSVVVAIAVVGGMWWLYTANFPAFFAVCTVIVLALDAIGHRRDAPPPGPRIATPTVLTEGVPLSQITKSIFATFEREGFEEGSVSLASPLVWDQERREYRIWIKTADEIKQEHVRAIERAIGADDYAIRNLATGTASVRELVIRVGDPLAKLVERPWIETGTRSVAEPLQLGVSLTDVPFALPFAGVHVRIVAGTGGGKTKWILRSIIDALSSCHDVVLGGIDLSNGPEMTLWRDVIQHKGFTVAEAEEVLDLAIEEIERRSKVLSDIAEDDDPTNDRDEWDSELGPAFIVLVDEFSQLAAYDGKKETPDGRKPNLLAKAEQIVRTGRKHWVSLVMLTQKTGNNDFGSSVMSSLCGVTIAGPCDPADTVRMFGVERRDAGYTPHLLSPGVEGEVRDAGKVFIDSPMHRTPDIYRAFAPGTTSEVKRRARQRVEDGLPRLGGGTTRPGGDVLDAVEVPPVVAAVAEIFDEDRAVEHIPTVDLLRRLGELGFKITDQQLSDAMMIDGQRCRARWRDVPGGPQIRGYTRDWVTRKIRSLG